MCMKVSCSHKIEAEEGLKVEFKSSLLFAPDNAPTYVQQEVIARTICAFINSEGGTLYLGVNDGGYPVGLSTDMKELSANPRRFTTKGAFATDEGYSYRSNIDQLYLKFQKIIEAYLGKKGLQHILDYDKKEDGSNVYLVIPVKPADKGDFIYFINHHGKAEIWIRTPGATRILTDKDRDDYIAAKAKERCSKETGNLLMSIQAQLATMLTFGKTKQDDGGSDKSREESWDNALKSLMSEVSSALFSREPALEDCIEYYATFDNQTSSMAIMDEFEKTYNGQKVYGRMVLGRYPALCSAPYCWDEADKSFRKIAGRDFGLCCVFLLIERSPIDNSLMEVSYRKCLTFSDLKGRTRCLQWLYESIWGAMTDEVKAAPVGGWHTILFKQFLGFKAHNSASQYRELPQYKIVGARFSKYKLGQLDERVEPPPYSISYYKDGKIIEWSVDRAYDELFVKFSSANQEEERWKMPNEYYEAKRRNRVKLERLRLKGKDAKLDVLELPSWLSIVLNVMGNVHTVGELANLTEERISANIEKKN